ncbi:hypothetical protein, partial [Cellulomonas bogoriensis]|uniref:hypothetical protein n=1 Tax=Cellulomonas bogoriensis TaxID=301388 RepID=UPI001E4F8115
RSDLMANEGVRFLRDSSPFWKLLRCVLKPTIPKTQVARDARASHKHTKSDDTGSVAPSGVGADPIIGSVGGRFATASTR